MANVELKTETSDICQCPICKTIYIDEYKCPKCNKDLEEIITVVTEVF